MGLTLAQFQGLSLAQLIPNASVEALNLIQQMIRWDPYKRLTAQQILTHPFFFNISQIAPTLALALEEPSEQKKVLEKPYQSQKSETGEDLDDIIDMLTDNNHTMPTKAQT